MRVPIWFTLDEADLDFTRTSTHRLMHSATARAKPDHIFRVAAGERFFEWLEPLRAWEWTSDGTPGLGSKREVHLTMLSARERMIAWEEGRRLTYRIEEASRPLVNRLVEDIQIYEKSDGTCRIEYGVHYEMVRVARPLSFLFKAMFEPLFARATQRLAEVSEELAKRDVAQR